MIMRLLLLFFVLVLFACSNKIYENPDWMIQVDLSDLKITSGDSIEYDTILNSNVLKFQLPWARRLGQKNDFQPEINIYDKFTNRDSLNYDRVFDTLYLCLQDRFEILISAMTSDNNSVQSFNYFVKGENRYLYNYYLINIGGKYYLIESISTTATNRDVYYEVKRLIQGLKPLVKDTR